VPEAYRIFLVRHAHAAPPKPGERDFDRQLDARGRDEAAIVTRQAEAFGIRPARIISSEAARCRETSAIVSASYPDLRVETSEALYSGTTETYLEIIAAHGGQGDLMIVGHNPIIEEMSEILLGNTESSSTLPYGFPTAGILGAEMSAGDSDMLRPKAHAVFLITPSFSETF